MYEDVAQMFVFFLLRSWLLQAETPSHHAMLLAQQAKHCAFNVRVSAEVNNGVCQRIGVQECF